MPDYYHDTGDISIMEELDPEPQPSGRLLSIREFLLGALLLVGVAMWAGWQSWQQDWKQSSYRMGEQAVAEQHWKEARDRFAAASGYLDADARAAEAAKSVALRDSHYQAATRGMSDTQWVAALNELQAVRTVQPDYKDTLALYAQAENNVYKGALEGAIALRTEAQPPGLYYRTGGAWRWLQGSDRWSQVRGSGQISGQVNSVVYDVPGKGGQPPPASTPVPPNREPPPRSSELEGRRLKVAALHANNPVFSDLSFDPAVYTSYIVTKKGVVAERFYDTSYTTSPVRSPYSMGDVDYQAYGSPLTTTVQSAGDSRAVLDISAETDQVLWATWSGVSVRDSDIKIYISNLDGTAARLVYAHTGELGAAQFSPDGRYILLTAITSNIGQPEEAQAMLLLNVADPGQVQTLATATASVQTMGGYFRRPVALQGIFLREGAFAGKALVSVQSKDGLTLNMYPTGKSGAANPSVTAVTTVGRISGPVTLGWLQEEQDGSGLTLAGMRGGSDFAEEQLASADAFFMRVVPGKPATVTYVPKGAALLLSTLGIRSGYLIYSKSNAKTGTLSYTLYSIPESLLGNDQPAPARLYETELNTNSSNSQTRHWDVTSLSYLGQQFLAYTEGGSLYARLYDGSKGVRLEGGVTYLFDPRSTDGMRWLR